MLAPRRLGGRVLKLGMQGPDVAALQKLLAGSWALIRGPPTGEFGWLTYEALREFQRAAAAGVVGVAGKQVFALLKDGNRLPTRRAHIVAPRRDAKPHPAPVWTQAGGPYAHNSSRSLKRLYEGQGDHPAGRLVIAYMAGGDRSLKSLLWHHRLSGVAGLWLQLGERQEPVGSIPEPVAEAPRERDLFLLPVPTNLGEGGYEGRLFRRAVRRGPRQKLIGQLRKALGARPWTDLDFRGLSPGRCVLDRQPS